MSGFVETPASKNSIANRRLIFGFGINDADYIIRKKTKRCPFYAVWHSMLRRCYSKYAHTKQNSYEGCSVCDKWFTFSTFKEWMIGQDWHGKQLDKDLLVNGNKVYSPSTCIFVTQEINKITSHPWNINTKYPRGVYRAPRSVGFSARCRANGKEKHIGTFDTQGEAHEAYKKFKYKYIAEIAEQQTEPLRSALLAYKIEDD